MLNRLKERLQKWLGITSLQATNRLQSEEIQTLERANQDWFNHWNSLRRAQERLEVNLSALRNEFDSVVPALATPEPHADVRDLPTDVQSAVSAIWGSNPLASTIARAGARELVKKLGKDATPGKIAEVVRNHGVTIE